jgi:hypothetical protein
MAVPQLDNHELHETPHSHATMTPASSQSIEQTNVAELGAALHEPHVHCESCDALMQARERRQNEKHCCTMVAVTFMTAFFCALLLGIVIVGRSGRHGGHDRGIVIV